jgi:4-amino-4-deoxy-L-arabinose transferase-like glycosyltransferase
MEERPSPSRFGPKPAAVLVVILLAGTFLRAWPSTGFHGVGYDEGIYSGYVRTAVKEGIWSYPDITRAYVKLQEERSDALVPATRIGFLLPASALAAIGHLDPRVALHCVSLISSILLLFATAIIGYRLSSCSQMLLCTTLMAVAPLQIHLAQRSLIDGYFALWAILSAWFLWETLQKPEQHGWLISYGVSLFVLVLTKENAAFVFLALVAVLVIFAVCKLGRATLALIVVTAVAPALAVLVLAGFVGGIREWIAFYDMFIQKSRLLPYPIRFQDGAWYRYLIDFTLLSPCVVAFATGRIFQLERKSAPDIFWSIFLGISFVMMSSVPYGMSLRFAAYWDIPLRWLAASQISHLAGRFRRINPVFTATAVILILAVVDLFQYWRYFVNAGIYDPVSFQLLHASQLIK